MINFVDEVLNTASTGGKIKYNVKHSDGTSEVVEQTLATPVTTQGTPLNKALFDSIKSDLNSRLLVNNKATANDVITGTNNTKYVTPQSLNGLIKKAEKTYPSTQTSVVTDTIYTFTSSNHGRMLINGWVRGYAYHESGDTQPYARTGAVILKINYNNGTVLRACTGATTGSDKEGFKIEIDFNTKQFYVKGNDYQWVRVGEASYYDLQAISHDKYYQFGTIESITIEGRYYSNRYSGGYVIAVYQEL